MVDVQQNGDVVLLVDADKVLHDLLCRDGVKRGDRLVGKNDLRVLVQRPRQSHALLLTAGELVAAGIRLIQNAYLVQTLERAHLLLLGEDAEQNPEKRHVGDIRCQDVFERCAARDQIEALENHADLAAIAAKLLAAQGIDRDAVDGQFALGNVVHPVDAAQNGRLARAGQTDDGDKLALLDLQVDVFQRCEAVWISLIHIFEFNHAATLFFLKI